MTTTQRKYALGGYILPVRLESDTSGGVRVVDANERLVKRFKCADMAEAMITRLNEPKQIQ